MAIVRTNQHSLTKQINKKIIKILIALILSILFTSICIATNNEIFMAVIFLPIIYSIYQISRSNILRMGIIGEKKVAKNLSKLSDEYIIYNDISIAINGGSAQIDHLVISPYGVFCIETKNMRGVITGLIEEKYWTQKKASKGGKIYKNKFYNPYKQSLGHSHKLYQLLKANGIQGLNIINIVVFTRRWTSTIKVNNKDIIIKNNKLLKFFDKYSNIRIDIDTTSKIDNIIMTNIL